VRPFVGTGAGQRLAKPAPIASTSVSAPIPSSEDSNHWDVAEDDRARAAAALQAAFDRLQPQGSDAWNFLGAFTHLGDRYGPYQPGVSALSKQLGDETTGSKRGGRLGRFVPGRTGAEPDAKSEVEDAMGWVVEAFRFLSGRVRTLEDRLDREDRPVDGSAWLVPAPDLTSLAGPIADHVADHTPGGVVVHADCGDGELLRALTTRGMAAFGVEPRGAIALGALEHGCDVSINEALDDLAVRIESSVGGLVLSGMVDRLPLHALLSLLTQCRRVLTLGAPLVVVTTDPAQVADTWQPSAIDLVAGRPLHVQTWQTVLERAGFTGVHVMPTVEGTSQTVITASSPT
jgi:hypothetical protein